MRFARLIAAVAAFVPSLDVAATDAQTFLSAPVALGVYECHDQMFNMVGTMMFGLLDADRYSNSDGHIGTYAYDPANGVIQVGLDTGAPARFARISETAFRAVGPDGTLLGFVCPLNRAKDAAHPPW